MEKFNLELALAGEPVIDYMGQEVTQITLFKFGNSSEALIGVVGNKRLVTLNDEDLFMKPKPLCGWANIYTYNGKLMTSAIYSTEQRALNQKDRNSGYVKTIFIDDSK